MAETTPVATTLSDRTLLRVGGEDPRGFLQGLTTQDMAGPLPVWTGLLTPQGKALFDFIIWADGDDLLLDCEAGQADALRKRLLMYRLRRPITIAAEKGRSVHWSPGRPELREIAAKAMPDPRLPALGWRWLAPAGAPAEGWLAHRLALGVCEGAAELGQDRTLWLECNAAELGGVSFAKGCYVGQENTARMHYRAKVNRRLVVAPLGAPGDRTRTAYPPLGLMVEFRRVEALGDALVPAWLAAALADPSGQIGSVVGDI